MKDAKFGQQHQASERNPGSSTKYSSDSVIGPCNTEDPISNRRKTGGMTAERRTAEPGIAPPSDQEPVTSKDGNPRSVTRSRNWQWVARLVPAQWSKA